MDFKKIENCFNDEFKRKAFLYKLKQCGENSLEMISIQHMLEKFKIHNPPRGIILTQTTILKHTFQFVLAKDCFQNFTLVCKSWNLAVETTKFKNQSPPYQVCKLCSPPSLTRLSKVLSSFDTLYMNFNSPPFLSDRQFARSRSVVPINENLLDQILCKMKFFEKNSICLFFG